MKRQLQKGGKTEGLKLEKQENNKNKMIVREMKEKIEGLNSEIFGLRKNYEALKLSSNKKILALESELEKLKKKEVQQAKTIEDKNKIIENLRNTFKKTEQKTKNSKKNLSNFTNSLKNSRSNSFSETPTLETQTIPEVYLNDSESLTVKIGKTEKELMDLGARYKALLESASSSSDNLPNIRKEIGEITLKMEEKNDILYSLKKKHQDHLRTHIKTLESSKNY